MLHWPEETIDREKQNVYMKLSIKKKGGGG